MNPHARTIPRDAVSVARRVLNGLIAAAILASACTEQDRPAADRSGDPQPRAGAPEALTPREVVQRVHAHRTAGRLGAVAPHLLPQQRREVIELLLAVDELTQADRVLAGAVTARFGSASAQRFDHTAVINSVGVFSRDVDVIQEDRAGDRAVVTIQVAGRVPLEQVELVRVNGAWMIETDPPIPEIPVLIRKLAATFIDVARTMQRDAWDIDRVQTELARRQSPILARIDELTREN